MIGVEMLAATPDMPSIAATAAFLFCLAKAAATAAMAAGGCGRAWRPGLALLSKYSGLFVGAGRAGSGCSPMPARARWLTTLWPWAGGALALLIFLPNLLWQAQHHWMTFAFQFGRVDGRPSHARFLIEFLGAQLGLATPFIFILAALGVWRARGARRRSLSAAGADRAGAGLFPDPCAA